MKTSAILSAPTDPCHREERSDEAIFPTPTAQYPFLCCRVTLQAGRVEKPCLQKPTVESCHARERGHPGNRSLVPSDPDPASRDCDPTVYDAARWPIRCPSSDECGFLLWFGWWKIREPRSLTAVSFAYFFATHWGCAPVIRPVNSDFLDRKQ